MSFSIPDSPAGNAASRILLSLNRVQGPRIRTKLVTKSEFDARRGQFKPVVSTALPLRRSTENESYASGQICIFSVVNNQRAGRALLIGQAGNKILFSCYNGVCSNKAIFVLANAKFVVHCPDQYRENPIDFYRLLLSYTG